MHICMLHFFTVPIAGTPRALALIQCYSRPDYVLLEQSCWTVYSVTQIDEQTGFVVVDVKSILAVVSMQPHNHHVKPSEQRFFVWENMGVDMCPIEQEEE